MAVTLKQIAEHAGVSTAAVHKILHRDGNFRPETRKRVLETAEKLGYRPNAAAKAIRTGRFDCIALLLSTRGLTSNLPSALLDGVLTELDRHHQKLTVARIPDEKLTNEGFMPRILWELSTDGLLINYNVAIPARMAELIEEHSVPSVWTNAKRPVNAVRPDDLGAGREATRTLLNLGHRRIAYLDYSYVKSKQGGVRHYSKEDRREGYRKEMEKAGCAPVMVHDEEGVSTNVFMDACRRLLASPDRPTAVVTYGDNECVCIEMAAGMQGLKVPRDLSIMTFSGSPNVPEAVGFSALLVPDHEVGQQGARMLLEALGGRKKARKSIVVPFPERPGRTLAGLSK